MRKLTLISIVPQTQLRDGNTIVTLNLINHGEKEFIEYLFIQCNSSICLVQLIRAQESNVTDDE